VAHVLRPGWPASKMLLAGGTAVAVLAPALMITGPAGAEGRVGGEAGRAGAGPAFSVGGFLRGVAATSASNAWAVGYTNTARRDPVIARWNGSAWKSVKSPNPSSAGTSLFGIDALSATQAWAVGETGSGPSPFIERWNGSTWAQVTAPKPASDGRLNGVAAVSKTLAWAVG
jgi:hypothetical protein